MGAMDPILPEYDIETWKRASWSERTKMACADWVLRGFGNPFAVYFFYPFKLVVFWLLPWLWFCTFSPGIGSIGDAARAWAEPIVFQKALFYSLFFEVFGLGCASGPLSGHYSPPIGGATYFLRAGTLKAPLFAGAPVIGGHKRTHLDVALYVALLGVLLWALVSPAIDARLHVLPVVGLLGVIGVRDRTIFLAARSEHYLTAAVCLLFPLDWIAGTKWVWAAIWFWAGISKLTRHFPAVLATMQSTSPLTHFFPGVRKAMFVNHPHDLNPSRLAVTLAHLGAVNELAIPLLLIFSPSHEVTLIGIALMLWLHAFVTFSVPLGVPIEWNVMTVYGAVFLFLGHPDPGPFTLADPMLIAYLAIWLVLIPLVGNLAPRFVSFLLSMRYYAGNWAYSVWLFEGDAVARLDERLEKPALSTRAQIISMNLYDADTLTLMLSKLPAFRYMHYQGRMLHTLIPQAVGGVARVDDYEYYDGEAVATLVLGWAFGDGHLHDERLLAAIQAECGFEEGQLRCIFVESQPLLRQSCAWRIVDAKTGELASGEMAVSEMIARPAWPVVPAT